MHGREFPAWVHTLQPRLDAVLVHIGSDERHAALFKLAIVHRHHVAVVVVVPRDTVHIAVRPCPFERIARGYLDESLHTDKCFVYHGTQARVILSTLVEVFSKLGRPKAMGPK